MVEHTGHGAIDPRSEPPALREKIDELYGRLIHVKSAIALRVCRARRPKNPAAAHAAQLSVVVRRIKAVAAFPAPWARAKRAIACVRPDFAEPRANVETPFVRSNCGQLTYFVSDEQPIERPKS